MAIQIVQKGINIIILLTRLKLPKKTAEYKPMKYCNGTIKSKSKDLNIVRILSILVLTGMSAGGVTLGSRKHKVTPITSKNRNIPRRMYTIVRLGFFIVLEWISMNGQWFGPQIL